MKGSKVKQQTLFGKPLKDVSIQVERVIEQNTIDKPREKKKQTTLIPNDETQVNIH